MGGHPAAADSSGDDDEADKTSEAAMQKVVEEEIVNLLRGKVTRTTPSWERERLILNHLSERCGGPTIGKNIRAVRTIDIKKAWRAASLGAWT